MHTLTHPYSPLPSGRGDSLLVKQLWRPIFLAVRFGHLQVAKYLLGAGIGLSDLSQPVASTPGGDGNWSLLHVARYEGKWW